MRWLLALFLALTLLIGTGAAASAGEHPPGPEIWFSPNFTKNPDFDQLWADDAPWQSARRKVDVLGLIHHWVYYASDDQIKTIADFAKRHNMRLVLETQAVLRATPTCGYLEGYSWPGQFQTVADKLKRLNIHIDMMDIDEPLGFGHYTTAAAGGCALSIPDLAANVASTIAPVLALYPGLPIYQIETLPGLMNDPRWREALSGFQGSPHDLFKIVR